MYFSNSHRSRVLPTPAAPETATSRAAAPLKRAVEQLLEQAQLAVAPDERRLEPLLALAPPTPATTRAARHSCSGSALPLTVCSPASS